MQDTRQEQYVEFAIGDGNYAIKISEIQEIIKDQKTTVIPFCRKYVRGVINLRGTIIPIISLRSLFSIDDDCVMKSTRIVVVNNREEAIGVMVDKVIRVTTFTHIQPPPDHLVGVSGANFSGIGCAETGLAAILTLDQVLLREEEK